jgi:hypothetical protein
MPAPLPCVAIRCPICLERLRALPVEALVLWRTYCARCQRRLSLKAEALPPDMPECMHSLVGGERCRDVVRCQHDWPLTEP